MPWFYFHVCDDDKAVPDRDGVEFSDDAQAMRHGESFAREILAQNLQEGCSLDKRRVEVRNEAGDVIGIFLLKNLVR
jgi:hypothetical protein